MTQINEILLSGTSDKPIEFKTSAKGNQYLNIWFKHTGNNNYGFYITVMCYDLNEIEKLRLFEPNDNIIIKGELRNTKGQDGVYRMQIIASKIKLEKFQKPTEIFSEEEELEFQRAMQEQEERPTTSFNDPNILD